MIILVLKRHCKVLLLFYFARLNIHEPLFAFVCQLISQILMYSSKFILAARPFQETVPRSERKLHFRGDHRTLFCVRVVKISEPLDSRVRTFQLGGQLRKNGYKLQCGLPVRRSGR